MGTLILALGIIFAAVALVSSVVAVHAAWKELRRRKQQQKLNDPRHIPKVYTGLGSWSDAELDVTHPDDSPLKKRAWHRRENNRMADGMDAEERVAAAKQALVLERLRTNVDDKGRPKDRLQTAMQNFFE